MYLSYIESMEIMDLIISLTTAAASLLIISFSISYLHCFFRNLIKRVIRTDGSSSLRLRTPPGRTGLPFIGETLDFLYKAKKGVPERFVLDRIKKYSSKVFKTSLFGQQVVVLGSPEGHKFLFSNENKLVKTRFPPHLRKLFPLATSLDLDEEILRLQRSLSPYFKPDSLQRYIPIIDSATKRHLQIQWDGKDVVPVLSLAKDHVFRIALRLFLGIEDEEIVTRLKKPLDELVIALLSLPLNVPGTRFHRGVKAKDMLVKEIDVLIKQWKSVFSETSISASGMVLADVLQQVFDEDDTVSLSGKILAMLLAGYETTSSTFAAIIMYMAKYPHVYEEVLAEQREITISKGQGEMLNWEDIQRMKYSWNVAREVLRLHALLPGAYKEAISDLTFDGFFIPKGSKLCWTPHSTHMNSEYFENPNKFDPTRFEGKGPIQYSYVPFGGGPHMCPGREYGRIKILVLMHNVVTKFRWEMVFPDEKMINDALTRPSKGLPVRLYPHNNF